MSSPPCAENGEGLHTSVGEAVLILQRDWSKCIGFKGVEFSIVLGLHMVGGASGL